MKRRVTLRLLLSALTILALLSLYGVDSCGAGCPQSPNPCERFVEEDSAGNCIYEPADGDSCNYAEQGDGICRDLVCQSGECAGVEYFQSCGAPMSGGFEGACVENFCASVVPIDECVKSGIGRINCCSQQGCADARWATECMEPLDGVPCDPTHVEPPGIAGQKGTCDMGVCVPNAAEACEGVRCPPSANVCKRNDLQFPSCDCQEWAVDGLPPCPTGFCQPGGGCGIVAGCNLSVDCSDGDPCTYDFCSDAAAVNGDCGPGGLDCCVHTLEDAGTSCELPGNPGQFGYCSSAGDCDVGLARNELSMGCTDNLDTSVELIPFELQSSPETEPIPGAAVNIMTVGGVVFLPEAYLRGLRTAVPGGADKVDVRGMHATVVLHHGGTGDDVLLDPAPIPYTCALGAGIPCDPANDAAGAPGHRANTDCIPYGSWNTCGRFVSLPTSTDCDPGGACDTVKRQQQCAENGFCHIDRLALSLEPQMTMYLTDPSGYVMWGWDDRNTGATVQSGGQNDGTWILPPADYAAPIGPNGLRLIFVNSMNGNNEDVAIECTMGVDSQGPHGVYSSDPLSSPTPLNIPPLGRTLHTVFPLQPADPQVHPCTAQGVAEAADGFPVRHVFSCGAPTTISISEDLDLANGVILDGEGLLTIEGGGIDEPTLMLVDSQEVGEVRNMGLSGVLISNRGQLALDNVTMTGSRAIRNHAGADLVVVNSSLTGNAAIPDSVGGPEYGGALRNEGVATITGTTLSGNVAADFGGAVYSVGSGGLTIEDSVITANSTSDLGGGLYVGSSASITNTTISLNTATGEGGGVYVASGAGPVTIMGGMIADNTAGNAGGGVFSRSNLTIDGGAVVSGNEATTGRGGGLFQDSNVFLTMRDAEVRDNSSGDDGGGIVVEGSLLLERTVVQTNTAAGEGGGIQVGSAGDASVTDASTITQNVAGGSGGGVRVFRGTLLVQDSTLDGNQAGAVGGGVSSYGDTSGTTVVTIERSSILGNTADSYGGGIESQWSRNTLTVIESAIVGNTSTSAGGGGVYVHDGVVGLIRNSTIAQNASSVGGGGIRVTDAATDLRVIFCTFRENTTGTSGEAIALISGTVITQNSIFAETCNTPLTSYGGNLQADADTCGMSSSSDAVVLAFSLNLSSLGLNGGPTLNYFPLPGSVAIDHSPACEGVNIDQRGVSRPQGPSCDCGAVEAQ